MAISYRFEIATAASALQVADAVYGVGSRLALFRSLDRPQRLLMGGAVTLRGTRIRVMEVHSPPWNPTVTDLGFAPTVCASFRLGRTTEISVQQDDMIAVVARLLDEVVGDAVLHSAYEAIWLLRRGGELTVGEQSDLWPGDRLAVIGRDVRRQTHRFSGE
jgi:hypothetical protein